METDGFQSPPYHPARTSHVPATPDLLRPLHNGRPIDQPLELPASQFFEPAALAPGDNRPQSEAPSEIDAAPESSVSQNVGNQRADVSKAIGIQCLETGGVGRTTEGHTECLKEMVFAVPSEETVGINGPASPKTPSEPKRQGHTPGAPEKAPQNPADASRVEREEDNLRVRRKLDFQNL